MAISKKGFFLSVDVLFAIVIAMIIIVAFSYNIIRGQQDPLTNLYLEKISNDALVVLDKNETLSTLDQTKIKNSLDQIFPDNLAYRLIIKVFECQGSQCNSFNEVNSKSLDFISPSTASESNVVIAKRSFLTFENQLIKYYSNAELRVWVV